MAKIRAVKERGVIVALVRAPNEAQAIRYYTRTLFTAAIATQDELVAHRDMPIEDAQIEPAA